MIRTRAIHCFLLLCLLAAQAAPAAHGASLWLNGRDLYSSKGGREFRPGDIITITITEQSSAQSAATTNTQDDASVEIKSGPQIPFFKKVVNQFIGKNEIKNQWQGNGTTTRSGKLTGTITASVLEILPNGNLLVEGSRSIRVNRENQIMKVKGIARPQDIDAKNTINSTLLADAQIKFEGKGTVGRLQRPGLMTKITNWLF